MIALALIAAHLVGDFVFQTRWQAAAKLDGAAVRVRHVYAYTAAFVPVVAIFWPGWARAAIFLGALFLLHFATDSRRFKSTLGDYVAWRLGAKGTLHAPHFETTEGGSVLKLHQDVSYSAGDPLPPNPWPPIPICIDQTLHVVQLAALGWLLSS